MMRSFDVSLRGRVRRRREDGKRKEKERIVRRDPIRVHRVVTALEYDAVESTLSFFTEPYGDSLSLWEGSLSSLSLSLSSLSLSLNIYHFVIKILFLFPLLLRSLYELFTLTNFCFGLLLPLFISGSFSASFLLLLFIFFAIGACG